MSALSALLPNLRDEDEALEIALRAVRQGRAESQATRDRLLSTAVEKDGVVYFRPYAAARAWLKAHPEWITELSSPDGGTKYRNLNDALAGLAEEQAALDAILGLTIPAHLRTSSNAVPGPVLTSWQ